MDTPTWSIELPSETGDDPGYVELWPDGTLRVLGPADDIHSDVALGDDVVDEIVEARLNQRGMHAEYDEFD